MSTSKESDNSDGSTMVKDMKKHQEQEQEEVIEEDDSKTSSSKKRKRLPPLPDIDFDAPDVLSRKKQRKARKESKKKEKEEDGSDGSEEEEESKKPKKKTSDTNSEKPSTRGGKFGVWVGNLSFATPKDKLKNYFAECGTIIRMNMPAGMKKTDNNRGFAYIDFDTKENAEKAVALSEGHLDGRRLLIKASSDFTGRPSAVDGENGTTQKPSHDSKSLSKSSRRILENQKNSPIPCLFFGNLSFTTEEDDLRRMIDAHFTTRQTWKSKKEGNKDGLKNAGIKKIRMSEFMDSGKCKGFCFVDFETVQHATEALIDPRNYSLNGRKLNIQYASIDAARRGGFGKGEGTKGNGGKKTGRSKTDDNGKENDADAMDDEAEPESASVPFVPKKIDMDAPPEKKHKPNQTERRAARRERELAKTTSTKPSKEIKTSNASNNNEGTIIPSLGKKILFD